MGKCRGRVWDDMGREHIAAVRTGGHGVLLCFGKFLASTNKRYSVNTNNNRMFIVPCIIAIVDE